MAKSYIHIKKINNFGALKARWNHDMNKSFRREHVDNADPERFDDNDVLILCSDEDGNEMSYEKAVKKRITGLRQSNGKKIRKDAVLAFDVILEFGDMDDIEAEGINTKEWEKQSLEWLQDTFNVAGDGKDNVISAVCHNDESSPHIHAIITPVDSKGSLCAKSFTDGAAALSRLQSSYADRLKELGIERGTKGSSAHNKPNKVYKAEKKKASELPSPLPGQSAEEYVSLYEDELKQKAIKQKERMDKLERKLRAEYDKERESSRSVFNDELPALKEYYSMLTKNLKDDYEKLEKELGENIANSKEYAADLELKIKDFENKLSSLGELESNVRILKSKSNAYDYQKRILEHAKIANPSLAASISEMLNDAEREYLDSQSILSEERSI